MAPIFWKAGLPACIGEVDEDMFDSHYWHLTDLYTRLLDQILFTIKQVISLLESDRKSIIYGSKYRIKPLTEWYINLHGICTNYEGSHSARSLNQRCEPTSTL